MELAKLLELGGKEGQGDTSHLVYFNLEEHVANFSQLSSELQHNLSRTELYYDTDDGQFHWREGGPGVQATVESVIEHLSSKLDSSESRIVP